MPKKKYSQKVINNFIKELNGGKTIEQISNETSISLSTLNSWKNKYAASNKTIYQRIGKLEKENHLLKALAADQAMTIFRMKLSRQNC